MRRPAGRPGRKLRVGLVVVLTLGLLGIMGPADAQPRALTITKIKHVTRGSGVGAAAKADLKIVVKLELESPRVEPRCIKKVPIKIQKKTENGWKKVGKTRTNRKGKATEFVPDKPGKYRAIAPRVFVRNGNFECWKAKSDKVRHRH